MNYLELLKNLDKDNPQIQKEDILVIDGLNTFLRAFSVVATVNPMGNNVGGLTGFLKSLGSLRRQFNPSRIIVVWDGKGGATNRKAINSNYKAQRVHASVIHWDMYDTKDEEIASMRDQIERLKDYLECLPVTFIQIDKLEADDVIAYIATTATKGQKNVTIVSSDKDFLQLVSDYVRVYSPVKKVMYNYEETCKFLTVLPENYNLVKSLIGDKSDNLAGVGGCGIKTLIRLFPKLVNDPSCDLQYIYDECAANIGKKKLYSKILTEWNTVENNYKLMDLQETVLDSEEKSIVRNKIKEPVPPLKVGLFMTYLSQDAIEGISSDTEKWMSQFSGLESAKKS